MRCHTLSAVVPLTLLGCTFHTYSAQTLPPTGFGAQAAPASGTIAYASGGEVGVVEQRDGRRGWIATRAREDAAVTGRAAPVQEAKDAAGNGSTPRAARAATAGMPRSTRPLAAAPAHASRAANDAKGNHDDAKGSTDAQRGRELRAAEGEATGATKPAKAARSNGGVVVLARGKASGEGARSSRGIAPVSHQASEPRSRALAALKAGGDDERARADEPGASDTAKLESGSDDAASTARLARSDRAERPHRADERASLAAK